MKKIAFSSITSHKHQILHILPVAMTLANQSDVAVTFLTKNQEEEAFIERLAKFFECCTFNFQRLSISVWLRLIQKIKRKNVPPKLPLLSRNIEIYRNFDVVVVPDMTSAYLKSMKLGSTKLVKLPHGCGDRELILDKRMGMFDLTIFPGESHRKRLLAAKIVSQENCTVAGYPKFEMIRQIGNQKISLFNNNRPTVVYIPHFKQDLASWKLWGKQILSFFTNSQIYNLIFAPHVRMYVDDKISYRELTEFQNYDNIYIDLHSERCIDMTYTSSADIYLGDVSSQVYEFVINPRPCVFLNAHQVSWKDDPSYTFWQLGPVVEELDQLQEALIQSQKNHPKIYKPRQEAYIGKTFSISKTPASVRAANAIRSLVGLPILEKQDF